MFANPRANLQGLEIGPGMHVADLGSGSGFYAIAAAHLVRGSGKVFAVDIQKDLLDRVKNTAAQEGLSNVEVVWGNIEQQGGTRLRDASVDRVILSNTLSQAEHRDGVAQEISRVLKPGGKLLLVDWSETSGIAAPDAAHLVGEREARSLFEKHGLSFEKKTDAGAHHYGIILKKP